MFIPSLYRSSVFETLGDLQRFQTGLEEVAVGIPGDAGKIIAIGRLEKEQADKWLYTLTWLEDGSFVGDYLSPFLATEENLEIFDFGCDALASILSTYIESDNPAIINTVTPPFSFLSHPSTLQSSWVLVRDSDGVQTFVDEATVAYKDGHAVVWVKHLHPTAPGFDKITNQPHFGTLMCEEYDYSSNQSCIRRFLGIYKDGSLGEHGCLVTKWSPLSDFQQIMANFFRPM